MHPDGPRALQMASDSSKTGSRLPQDVSKTRQDGPGRLQDGSEGPKMDPRGRKMGPKSGQEAS